MNLNNPTTIERITEGTTTDRKEFAISPDETYMVYTYLIDGNKKPLILHNFKKTITKEITFGANEIKVVSISPDSKHIALEINYNYNDPNTIVILDSDSDKSGEINLLKDVKELIPDIDMTNYPIELRSMSFSFDGKKVVFTAILDKPYAFISDTEGKNIIKVPIPDGKDEGSSLIPELTSVVW